MFGHSRDHQLSRRVDSAANRFPGAHRYSVALPAIRNPIRLSEKSASRYELPQKGKRFKRFQSRQTDSALGSEAIANDMHAKDIIRG